MGWILALLGCDRNVEPIGKAEPHVEDSAPPGGSGDTGTATLEELGRRIFFDERLSANGNQSCAACHDGAVGWTGPGEALNREGAVYEGSVPGSFGDRKPTTSAYADRSPVFAYTVEEGFSGGNFWDGRATGWKLGSAIADQAQGPFLNPAEQALPDAATVVRLVCEGPDGDLFRAHWGAAACDDASAGYDDVALSIAAYESSPGMSKYSSKYDAFLAGEATLTAEEEAGRLLFTEKANCPSCHAADGDRPAFTDATYDNIGAPRNPANPTYRSSGGTFVDEGLAGFLTKLATDETWRSQPHVDAGVAALAAEDLTSLAAQNRGRHRIPTLRNVNLRPTPEFVKAYTHNGWFKSLSSLVHFYNTRDVLPRCTGDVTEADAIAGGCWPAPEVADTVSTQVGDLGLTAEEEAALVSFLGTLSDGWAP